jgi:septum formation protein
MLYLASQSATRKALLESAGVTFLTTKTSLDEKLFQQELSKLSPAKLALQLASAKALNTKEAASENFVLGVDQVLSCDARILHKSASREAAKKQIRELSGRTHELTVGLCLVQHNQIRWSHFSMARMKMRAVSDAFIETYMRTCPEDILLSVGAYQYEGLGIQLFETIEGDYHTILGLPLLPLLSALRQFKIIAS